MFRKQPQQINGLVSQILRDNGLETPLRQRRLMAAWPRVAGEIVARYTEKTEIRNQTLWVTLTSPALRADLQMLRTKYVRELNDIVGAQIITDIRFC